MHASHLGFSEDDLCCTCDVAVRAVHKDVCRHILRRQALQDGWPLRAQLLLWDVDVGPADLQPPLLAHHRGLRSSHASG